MAGAETSIVEPTMPIPLPTDRPMPAGSDTASTVPVFGWRSTAFVFVRPELSVTLSSRRRCDG